MKISVAGGLGGGSTDYVWFWVLQTMSSQGFHRQRLSILQLDNHTGAKPRPARLANTNVVRDGARVRHTHVGVGGEGQRVRALAS